MGDYGKMFEWIEFPQGRVRYAGGMRGRDEPHINAFAVEVYGCIYYGEISELFLADRHNFNLEIISFGWIKEDWSGTEPDPRYCAAFTVKELLEVQSLIYQAVPEWLNFDDRPIILTESPQSHFMGEIIFRDGWALLRDEGSV